MLVAVMSEMGDIPSTVSSFSSISFSGTVFLELTIRSSRSNLAFDYISFHIR